MRVSEKKCYVLRKRKCRIKASRKLVGTKRKNNNLSNIFDFLHVTRRLRAAYILTLQSLNIYIGVDFLRRVYLCFFFLKKFINLYLESSIYFITIITLTEYIGEKCFTMIWSTYTNTGSR